MATVANLNNIVISYPRFEGGARYVPTNQRLNCEALAPVNGFLSATTGTNGLTIDRFNFRQNAASGGSSIPAAMQWDELRIGNSWAEVTPPVLMRFSSVNLLPDHRVQLQAMVGVASVAVETSSNLVNWLQLTNILSANGTVDYIDPATNETRRFYRLKIRRKRVTDTTSTLPFRTFFFVQLAYRRAPFC